MCKAMSWVEKDGHLLYLTGADLETERGKLTVKYCGNADDLRGHGAIRYYYGSEAEDGTIVPLSGGTDREVTDFSSPANFPREIADAIRRCAFRGVWGLNPETAALIHLDNPLWAEWKRAYAERKRAYAEWERAYAEWKRAVAEWERAYAGKFWDLFALPQNRNPAWV